MKMKRKMISFFFIFPSNGAPVEWNWQGKTEVLGGKTCPSDTLSATNPTWTDTGSNPGLQAGDYPPEPWHVSLHWQESDPVISTLRSIYIRTYIHTFILTYVHTYLYTDMYTYICTYILIYLHIYIHSYVHTYIYTYVHTYTVYVHSMEPCVTKTIGCGTSHKYTNIHNL
jgi:hypothetical protein